MASSSSIPLSSCGLPSTIAGSSSTHSRSILISSGVSSRATCLHVCCSFVCEGGSYFKDTRLLIYHGTADRIVPYWMGMRLFAVAGESGAVHCKVKRQRQQQPQQQQQQQHQQYQQQKQQQQSSNDRFFSAIRRRSEQETAPTKQWEPQRGSFSASPGTQAPAAAEAAVAVGGIPFVGNTRGDAARPPSVGLLAEKTAAGGAASAAAALEEDEASADEASVHSRTWQRLGTTPDGEDKRTAEASRHLLAAHAECDELPLKQLQRQQNQRLAAKTDAATSHADVAPEVPVRGSSHRRRSAAGETRGLLAAPPPPAASYSDTEALNSSNSSSSAVCPASPTITSGAPGNPSAARWPDTPSDGEEEVQPEAMRQSRVAVLSERTALGSPHGMDGSQGSAATPAAPPMSPDCPECLYSPHVEVRASFPQIQRIESCTHTT